MNAYINKDNHNKHTNLEGGVFHSAPNLDKKVLLLEESSYLLWVLLQQIACKIPAQMGVVSVL